MPHLYSLMTLNTVWYDKLDCSNGYVHYPILCYRGFPKLLGSFSGPIPPGEAPRWSPGALQSQGPIGTWAPNPSRKLQVSNGVTPGHIVWFFRDLRRMPSNFGNPSRRRCDALWRCHEKRKLISNRLSVRSIRRTMG